MAVSLATGGNIKIRLAASADEEIIKCIARDAFAKYIIRMDKKPFPMLADYGKHIASGHTHVLEMNGGIVAYIILIPNYDGSLLLDNLGVFPRAQNHGIGGRLLTFAENECRRLGFRRLKLYTNEAMAENISWYKNHGYVIIGQCVENGYKRIYFEKSLA